MPNLFVDHKDRWLSLAESDSDFAVHFIRAWIPFNVWYCNSYPHNNNKDRPTLDQLKVDNNLFRTRIVSLLSGSNVESIQFKNLLGQLHLTLERYFIPDAANRITFQNLYFRNNPITVFTPVKKRSHDFKAELLTNGSVQAIIIDSNTAATKFSYTHTKYDLDHFIRDSNFKTLVDEKRNYIEHCFKQINTKRKENLISVDPRNRIDAGGIMFLGDAELLSQALIELLYRLRCILFHGEIQPSKDNLSIYEPAYHMLRILLKSLI